ncbi:MAG: hypothetical protein LBM99_00690 [Bacillales bacterium]|jgi:hypothetical protein|nr:hypothetical protein [Bacillales bacterium]
MEKYEINNGLLGMGKFVIVKLLVIHSKQNIKTWIEDITWLNSIENLQLKIVRESTKTNCCLSSMINTVKGIKKIRIIKKRLTAMYNLIGEIFNKQITIKHLFAVSQELQNYRFHYYYVENI